MAHAREIAEMAHAREIAVCRNRLLLAMLGQDRLSSDVLSIVADFIPARMEDKRVLDLFWAKVNLFWAKVK